MKLCTPLTTINQYTIMLPPITTELTLEQQASFHIFETQLSSNSISEKDLKDMILSLYTQNKVLSNNFAAVTKAYIALSFETISDPKEKS